MFSIHVISTGVTFDGLKRHLQAAKKIAHTDIGNSWQKDVLPDHFKMVAYERYDYADRGGMAQEKLREKAAKLLKRFQANSRKRGVKSNSTMATAMRAAERSSYVARKRREKHHSLPLVFSGQARTAALNRDVRATSSKTDVVINARILNFRQPGGPNMFEEVTTVIPSEQEAIEKEFLASLERELKKSKPVQRRRVVKG